MKVILLLFSIICSLSGNCLILNQKVGLPDEIIKLTGQEYETSLASSEKKTLGISSIVKKEGVIIIETKNTKIVLADHLEANCQACVKLYEVVGELPSISKLIIEEQQFRSSTSLLIDLSTGKIDTLQNDLFFSPNLKLLINSNQMSKDQVIGGFKIFEIIDGELSFNRIFQADWRIKELNWTAEGELLIKANPIEDEMIYWNRFEYYKIKI
ncbi:MAG: hypothetical protein AAFY71_12150 [Bacteroidota bacterium]